jgi:hypothetical protein
VRDGGGSGASGGSGAGGGSGGGIGGANGGGGGGGGAAREMRTTVVDLLGSGDGSSALLEAARCWGDGTAGHPTTGATTPRQLEAWMSSRGSMLPNTEVTVVFGRHFHLAGYPPWQLHKTEIYHVSSLWRFSRKGLAEVLRKYSKVSQRFGK